MLTPEEAFKRTMESKNYIKMADDFERIIDHELSTRYFKDLERYGGKFSVVLKNTEMPSVVFELLQQRYGSYWNLSGGEDKPDWLLQLEPIEREEFNEG